MIQVFQQYGYTFWLAVNLLAVNLSRPSVVSKPRSAAFKKTWAMVKLAM